MRSPEPPQARRRGGAGRPWAPAALLLIGLVGLSACGDSREEAFPSLPAVGPPTAADVPNPDLADMEPRVQFIIRDARSNVLANLADAAQWGRYGMILDAHEAHAAAIQAYSTAQRLAPREFRWAYLLARVLELQEFEQIEVDLVESAWRRARDLNQSYAPLFVHLGSVLVTQGKHEEGRAAFRRALDLDPDLAAAAAGLTRTLLLMGETQMALESIQPFAAAHPQNWEVQMLLARASAVNGDAETARRAAEHARSLPQTSDSPDPVVAEMMAYAVSGTACFKRARSLALAGDYENAVMNLKVVEEVRPDYAAAQERLGWCYLRMDKPKLARRHFARAAELDPGMAEAYLGLAEALTALGLTEEAKQARLEGERRQETPPDR